MKYAAGFKVFVVCMEPEFAFWRAAQAQQCILENQQHGE